MVIFWKVRETGKFKPNYVEDYQANQLIEISQEEFMAMRDSIDASINRDTVGLDDLMLKKILLAYNTGKYSRNADIIIELGSLEGDKVDCDGDGKISYNERNYSDYNGDGQITEEEIETFKANADLIRAFNRGETSLFEPFTVLQGKKLEQLNVSNLRKWVYNVTSWITTSEAQAEINEKWEKQDKYYLHAKGVLIFYNENYDPSKTDKENEEHELVYYDSKALDKLYQAYEDSKYWENRDYAESVWEYISSKAYTDGEEGIKMYGSENIQEELTTFKFKDDDDPLYVAINKILIPNNFVERDGSGRILRTSIKNRTIQDLNYYSLVSQYATPVEFMIDLLNISSSQEFVNSFIDKVVNQTNVKLKVYKTRHSFVEEKTEEIHEQTTVLGEIELDAEVIKYDKDDDLEWHEGTGGIRAYATFKDTRIVFGAIDAIDIKVIFTNIPSNVEAFQYKIVYGNGTSDGPYTVGTHNQIGDSLGRTKTEEKTVAWLTRYKRRINSGEITRVTTKGNISTQLDIAIEEANTWYGKIINTNQITTDTTYETKRTEYGSRYKISTASPYVINKTTTHVCDSGCYTHNWYNVIKNKSIADYTSEELGRRFEEWYRDLTSDNLLYYATGGPITHNIYEWLDEDYGRKLSNEDELLNIRYNYAMQEGWGDDWIIGHYTVQDVTYTTDFDGGYHKVKYLYTTVDKKLETTATRVEDDFGFFLSLLKNNTGKYDKNASYNPNGKEVEYKTVYDSVDRVGRFFETSAEMFFNLLNTSDYTRNLIPVMKYILYQYTTKNYGVTVFNYDIIPKEGFGWI